MKSFPYHDGMFVAHEAHGPERIKKHEWNIQWEGNQGRPRLIQATDHQVQVLKDVRIQSLFHIKGAIGTMSFIN